MKTCSKCKVSKTIDLFHIDKRTGKSRSYCKQCQSNLNKNWRKNNQEKVKIQNRKDQLKYKLKNIYNLKEKDLQKMINIADGKCMICNRKTFLHIDHCHSTGKVRGLLCKNCNLGIGLFKDNPEILKSCIEYLTSSGSPGW